MQVNPNDGIEHSAWIEDWSANLDTQQYINDLPNGVNTINIFVGQLDIVDGKATIDGYTSNTPGRPAGSGAFPSMAALTDFISQLRAKGITVKLSIGGQSGTTFGDSWNKLTSENVPQFAQALQSLCSQTGAEGIDFDDELEDTGVAALAGQLAAQFKELCPDLQTSFCVFGGCGTSGPLHAVDSVFLENAKLPDGASAIDRIYAMTYYDGYTLQQNENAMMNWKNWLQNSCGISASQISIGVDPNDPNTSPNNGSLKAWIEFAKENGFSTAIWDQQGSLDYISHNWGEIIEQYYNES